MKKKIIIIGAGMGGLAAGIYGQRNGFDTAIFEAHDKPGGQCTSWTRKGYVFDGCIHYFGGGSDRRTVFNRFWEELGAFPCRMVGTDEVMSAVFPDGTYFHDYFDLEKLESHMKRLAPEDTAAIDGYIKDIRRTVKYDADAAFMLGSFREKLASLPGFFPLLKYFRGTLDSYAQRFRNPLLRQAFPLLHYSARNIPAYLHLIKHADAIKGGKAFPFGGGLTLSVNMASLYERLGGSIRYRQKVTKILTENNRACGVELVDGTRHHADFIVSNADGRKTIMNLLGGWYVNEKIARSCEPNKDDECSFAVMVFLGVKRDLSAYPAALLLFLDTPVVIAGAVCDHLELQLFGSDSGMAPRGKGVIKVELYSKPSYCARLIADTEAYRAEKKNIAEQLILLLEKRFPGLRGDIEVVDVATLHTWERFMGGTQGFNNYPNRKFKILETFGNSKKKCTLPGLKNFYFTGQWVTSAGALMLNALSGKNVIRRICRLCGVRIKKQNESGRSYLAGRGR
jgi:phytoene dehydrogenase-like protein